MGWTLVLLLCGIAGMARGYMDIFASSMSTDGTGPQRQEDGCVLGVIGLIAFVVALVLIVIRLLH